MSATASLLDRVRRRLRLSWLVAASQTYLVLFFVAALALVVLGRFVPWGWVEPAAWTVCAVGALSLIVTAVVVRISAKTAARATDRGLGTKDAFVASMELVKS